MKVILLCLFLSLPAMANKFGYLDESEQKHFKNNSQAGLNSMERIDSNVREINKLHADIASLKLELESLKVEVSKLRNKKD